VAAVQYRATKGDVERSRASLVRLAERAAVDSDLIVLPEMAATGYVFPDAAAVRAVAELADGPTLAALAPIARAHRAWVVCGFPERAGDRLFNSALVIDPTGALRSTYRKTLLYEADVHWATPGDSGYGSFDADAGRFAVGICMDLNDDRFVAWLRTADPDAVAFPTNWVESADLGIDTWTYWAWRLQGLRAGLVAANTWGTDGEVRFTGESCALRNRTILAHLSAEGNGVLRARW
jgi:predicted amidohydrolase